MLKTGVLFLSLLWLFCCGYALRYASVPPLRSPVNIIPDPKWHFFVQNTMRIEDIAANVTPAHPVLRACTLDTVYKALLVKGQPRTEILTLFQEKRGDFLVNFTMNGDEFFVNGQFYLETQWAIMNVYSEIWLEKLPGRTEIWSIKDIRRNYDDIIRFNPPEYEWVYIKVQNKSCSEIKIKVVDGYVNLAVNRRHMAFPTEPYDDTFFTPSTTTTTTTAAALMTLPSKEEEDITATESSSVTDTVQKASSPRFLIYAVCGVSALIATGMLVFLGYRLGRCHARRSALKKGLIKAQGSSTVPNGTADEAAVVPNACENGLLANEKHQKFSKQENTDK